MEQQLATAARWILGDEEGAEFHARWQSLLEGLQRKFWRLERARIEDALAEAILHRLTRKDRAVEGGADEKGDLSVRSLYREVCHLICNGARADKRRRHREREYARQKKNWFFENFFVQNGLSAEHISIENPSDEELERLLLGCNAWEREFVTLRKQGIKDPSAYAELLGMVQRPLEEQRRAVAQAWDRIRMKLRRLKQRQALNSDRQ